MAFPGLSETSKMQIFASIVHYLRTNNVNVYVSKIFPSGLIFVCVGGEGMNGELIFRMLIWFHI